MIRNRALFWEATEEFRLARELGISRFGLIRRLNLLRLAPEIQERIMAMPPDRPLLSYIEANIAKYCSDP